jgi:hypothetical protein
MSASGERFPGAELFLDGNGQLNEMARRAWWRVQADLMYLSLWRERGAVGAGVAVCAEFGHGEHVRGGRCQRCGQFA